MDALNSLKIALIQTSIYWENPEKNRNSLSKKIALLTTDTDLIILPEMFTTGFTMNPSNIDKNQGEVTLKWMQKIAYKKQTAITGSILFLKTTPITINYFLYSQTELTLPTTKGIRLHWLVKTKYTKQEPKN